MFLVLMYFLIPVFAGYVMNVMASPPKRLWYGQQVVNIRGWGQKHYSAAFFALMTIVFCVFGTMAVSGFKFSDLWVFLILTVNCVAALVYLYHHWGVAALLARYGAVCKLLLVPMAIVVTALSKVYSDAGIADFAKLAPQDLPSAQLVLTLVLTPVLWLTAVALLTGYISMIVIPLLFLLNIFLAHRQQKSLLLASSASFNNTALAAVILGALFLLSLAEKVLSRGFYEPLLKNTIAFSSFHLPATYCGLPDVNGLYVTPLADGRAILALPDEKEVYKFISITCVPKMQNSDETTRMLYDPLEKRG